jgi:hypothetical protein
VLARALRHRFDRHGADDDLREAIDLAEEAVAAIALGDPNWSSFHNEVGIPRQRAFERFQNPAGLMSGIKAREAAAATAEPGSADHGGKLANLANAHRVAYDRSGRLNHLEKAVEIGTRAVAVLPLPTMLSVLAIARQQRFEVTGRSEDLEEALAYGRRAAEATPAGDPTLVSRLSNLAVTHIKSHLHTGVAADLDDVIALAARAVGTTPPEHPDLAR